MARSEQALRNQREYIVRYNRETYRDVHIKFRRDTDKEIVEWLDGFEKGKLHTYLEDLIRKAFEESKK